MVIDMTVCDCVTLLIYITSIAPVKDPRLEMKCDCDT